MKKVIIIAEAGVNHNGDIELAKQLIDAAANANVDYVKFQTFKAEKIATKQTSKAEYQVKSTGNNDSQLSMLKKLELDLVSHRILIDYCVQRHVKFLSTPFDLESIDLLKSLNISLGKIPSGEITNLPYLRKMAENFEKLILSTGMSTIEEIEAALEILKNRGKSLRDITVLHCTSEYPSPMEEINLKAMQEIHKRMNVDVGYSDHSLGIEIPIAAVAMGATLIEKHFTLNKKMEGPDHVASLEPDELTAMVSAIRNIEKALGDGIKAPSPSEQKNKMMARKSIVAAAHIAKGEIFTEENLTTKRPGTGISPMKWDNVVGQTAQRDFGEDELITL